MQLVPTGSTWGKSDGTNPAPPTSNDVDASTRQVGSGKTAPWAKSNGEAKSGWASGAGGGAASNSTPTPPSGNRS